MKDITLNTEVRFPKGFIEVILKLIESTNVVKSNQAQCEFDMLHIPWHVKIVVSKKKADPNVS